MLLPCAYTIVILLGGIVARYQRALGQFLVEALLRRAVDEQVQRLRRRRERHEREKGPHCDLGGVVYRGIELVYFCCGREMELCD